MDSKKEILQIDVKSIISKKSPKLAKILPGFVLKYLERILHQEEINTYLRTDGNKYGLEFVEATIKFMELSVEVKGLENIPAEGRFIFVANHPLGALESLVFMKEVSKVYPDLKFPVNDILMNLKNLEDIFVPINKLGGQSRKAVKELDNIFASGSQVLFFPAGLCSRKIKGEIIDLEWQKYFVVKAVQSKRDIIPVFIDGRNSNFFYNLSNFRTALGIKANIEMLYLVDEMFKQRGQTIKIVFGKPVSSKIIDNSKSYPEWAQYFKEMSYSLKRVDGFLHK